MNPAIYMHNAKNIGGTIKGLLGELLFMASHSEYLLPSFHPKHKYIPKMMINKQKKLFLYSNWNSIDAILYNGKIIVEIKTRNYYPNPRYKPKATQKSIAIMLKAKTEGFETRLAIVTLKENWNYEISVKEFNKDLLCIDKEKQYDKKEKKEQ